MGIHPELHCAVCLSIVDTTLKKLTYKKSVLDIVEALETACKYTTKDYEKNDVPLTLKIKDKSYDYNPLVVNGVCQLLGPQWEDKLIDLFKNRQDFDVVAL